MYIFANINVYNFIVLLIYNLYLKIINLAIQF